MNRRYEIIPSLFWMGISIFVMIGSYKLELGNFHDPGPGLMPFLIAIVLFIISIPVVVQSLSKIKTRDEIGEKETKDKINIVKVISISGLLFAYALLLEKLGYLFTTAFILIFLFKIAGSQRWWFVLTVSVLIAILTYFVFSFLGLRFPQGIFRVR